MISYTFCHRNGPSGVTPGVRSARGASRCRRDRPAQTLGNRPWPSVTVRPGTRGPTRRHTAGVGTAGHLPACAADRCAPGRRAAPSTRTITRRPMTGADAPGGRRIDVPTFRHRAPTSRPRRGISNNQSKSAGIRFPLVGRPPESRQPARPSFAQPEDHLVARSRQPGPAIGYSVSILPHFW